MLKTYLILDNKDYVKCDWCEYSFGYIELIDDEWEYCPKCGKPLYSC